MTAVYSSKVWACWDGMYDTLAAVAWTAHPSTGKVPPVRFAGSRDIAKEMITVPGMKPPTDGSEYATMGVVGRDEAFTLIVYLWSEVAGYVDTTGNGDPSRAARNRVRDLTALVETAFRDQTTGRPAGIAVAGVWKWEVTAVVPAIGVIEGGYGADCTIDITFTARI